MAGRQTRACARTAHTGNDGLTASLPDDLLADILVMVGMEHAQCVTAVCKRWARLFFADPRIWRSFSLEWSYQVELQEEKAQRALLEGKYRLLLHVAPCVETFGLRNGYNLQHAATKLDSHDVYHFLRALDPRHVSELSLDYLTLKVAKAVRCYTGLTSLALEGDFGNKLPRFFAAIPNVIGQLRALRLCTYHLPTEALAAIAGCSGLSALSLTFHGIHQLYLPPSMFSRMAGLLQLAILSHVPMPETMSTVAELTTLTSLLLSSAAPALGSATVRQLTGLSRLRHLTINSIGSGNEDGVMAELEPVHHLLADFPALERFQNEMLYEIEVGGATVVHLDYNACLTPPPGSLALELCFDDLQLLQQLLSALVPLGVPLTALTLRNSEVAPAAVQPCPVLSALTALEWADCYPEYGDNPAAPLEALLAQAPRLAELSCIDSSSIDFAVPQGLVQYTGLRRLILRGLCLTALPEGPYLSECEELELSENKFTHLPCALATATRLERLVLDKNPGLHLAATDAQRTLLPLKCLRLLSLRGCPTPPAAALERLRSGLPLLDVAGVRVAAFGHLSAD